jgi:hypothetical protein
MIPNLKTSTKFFRLCLVLVLVLSAPVAVFAADPDAAAVYLVEAGPVPGESNGFWDGLDGTHADLRPWGGEAREASGWFYLAVDNRNLYIRAVITDSSPQANALPNRQTWNGTSIEVFFGTKTSRHITYDKTDSQLRFWVPSLDEKPLPVKASRNNVELRARNFKAWAEWREDGYTIEASVSLAALEISGPFKAGQQVRCEFRINHAPPNSGRNILCNWRNRGDTAHSDASTWGDGIIGVN